MLTNLKKFVSPIGEALVAICRLFQIGTSSIVLQPINKKVTVFLQDQELSKDNKSLVRSFALVSGMLIRIDELRMAPIEAKNYQCKI